MKVSALEAQKDKTKKRKQTFNVSKTVILSVICFILLPFKMNAQSIVERRQQDKPDTLSLADRLSLRTNATDWLLLTPNLSIEYEINNKNWNRWSLGLGVRYNWQTKHSFKPAQIYNLAEVRAEVRHYWHTRQIDTVYLPAHGKRDYWGRLISARRYKVKHPNTTYYRGAYVALSKYSLLLTKNGYQGKALTAGFSYGIIKPLYVFSNGNSLDLDLGFSAGLCYTQYDKYYHDRESDCYPVTEKKDWHLLKYPVLSEARVAFVYRLGKYPTTKKYRWRYDVDADFRVHRNEISASIAKEKSDKVMELKSLDDLQKAFDRYYQNARQRQQREAISTRKEDRR